LKTIYFVQKNFVKIITIFFLSPFIILFCLLRIRFFDVELLNKRIGHLASDPDLYIKTGILNWRPRYFTILLTPKKYENNINKSLLEYWSKYICIIQHPLLVTLLKPLAGISLLRDHYVVLADGRKVKNRNQAQMAAQAAYETRFGGQPLATLTPAHRERGWKCLESLGVPKDGWFVCLHVRESGFLPQLTYHSYRDADVSTYLPSVQWIVDQGGWVIRMGDPTMKPLPPLNRVIDYPHSHLRCDWMDIFLCAECKFFLGTSSGLFDVAYIFGRPCALANFAPLTESSFSSKDIYIQKLYYSLEHDRIMTNNEIIGNSLHELYYTDDYIKANIKLIDNTEDEILELVKEMTDRLNGSCDYSKYDELLQKQYKLIMMENGIIPSVSRVGTYFLHKHRFILN
jgi:putative glycosyltransferase (TIGR04372 family)